MFSAMDVWSVGAQFRLTWHWPPADVKPLSSVLRRRRVETGASGAAGSPPPLITLHFSGDMELRGGGLTEVQGSLYLARAGDVVYSRIDVRSGAIGVVPANLPEVAVSGEYPVYEVDRRAAFPEYVKLVFRSQAFRRAINSLISGTSGRKRVQPASLESIAVPLPALPVQAAVVAHDAAARAAVAAAMLRLEALSAELSAIFLARCPGAALDSKWLTVRWRDVPGWDLYSARAAAFRRANPEFRPLSDIAAEATELVRPWDDPEKEWPVYGVNNKEGVFFSHYQKGRDFNAPYKRIRKDWFFHNPTRSSVGSLGVVPDVPDDAITSPEYQVWRIKDDTPPEYVAAVIATEFFLRLIRFHRVGAVKQRLYVDDLLRIRVPQLSDDEQARIAAERHASVRRLAAARAQAAAVSVEVEEMILGTRPVPSR
jgi:hypothetical protein